MATGLTAATSHARAQELPDPDFLGGYRVDFTELREALSRRQVRSPVPLPECNAPPVPTLRLRGR